jgi:hypothetical protein
MDTANTTTRPSDQERIKQPVWDDVVTNKTCRKESILCPSNSLGSGYMLWVCFLGGESNFYGADETFLCSWLIILRLTTNQRHARDSPQCLKVYSAIVQSKM